MLEGGKSKNRKRVKSFLFRGIIKSLENEKFNRKEIKMNDQRIFLASDYMETGHPLILERFKALYDQKFEGYGFDPITESAREKIRKACDAPGADVYFISGGTQTNKTIISSFLKSYEGVLAARTGHVNTHEGGAIERTGHKVLILPEKEGKISANAIEDFVENLQKDGNREHFVQPGMVYLSQPTECGTLYSKKELASISDVTHRYGMKLFVDGARLAYSLACPENDLTLKDLAKFADVFYIGGTKCGAMLGEAVVIPKKNKIPHFFTILKQHGSVLAKGWICGVQFDVLFEDDLYFHIGKKAVQEAQRIREICIAKGLEEYAKSPTNQIFIQFPDRLLEPLGEKVYYAYHEKTKAEHTAIRFCTSWATPEKDIDHFEQVIDQLF